MLADCTLSSPAGGPVWDYDLAWEYPRVEGWKANSSSMLLLSLSVLLLLSLAYAAILANAPTPTLNDIYIQRLLFRKCFKIITLSAGRFTHEMFFAKQKWTHKFRRTISCIAKNGTYTRHTRFVVQN